jgi:hypothetical protein
MEGLLEVLLLLVLFAIFSGVIARSKKRNELGWALIGLLFGPFGLIVGFLPAQEENTSGLGVRKLTACKQCREPIQYNARVCKHCGIRFPYLSEPARSHVNFISDLYIKGATPSDIAATLNKQSIRPANAKVTWDVEDIENIIRDHIA